MSLFSTNSWGKRSTSDAANIGENEGRVVVTRVFVSLFQHLIAQFAGASIALESCRNMLFPKTVNDSVGAEKQAGRGLERERLDLRRDAGMATAHNVIENGATRVHPVGELVDFPIMELQPSIIVIGGDLARLLTGGGLGEVDAGVADVRDVDFSRCDIDEGEGRTHALELIIPSSHLIEPLVRFFGQALQASLHQVVILRDGIELSGIATDP